MKRKPGDVVITYKLNVSEVARTNTAKGEHPFDLARLILQGNLYDIYKDPAISERSIVWNGVNVGSLKIDRVRGKDE